jgi:hypothetical protein
MLLERIRQPFTYALLVLVVLAVMLGRNSVLMVLFIEQGLLQDDDLQTETMVMPFHYTVDLALNSINGNGRKAG